MRVFLLALWAAAASAQPVAVEVDFGRKLQRWDGFGVNYVETAQTRDYRSAPQEYGGLSTLSEDKRQQLLDAIFGEDGLKPSLVKMFLDVWHQPEPGGPFDHETTTKWMRYFVKEGLKRTRARGGDLQIITTLYGPPAWATRQKFVRGRDLDPAHAENLGGYLIHWLQYLKREGYPVRYVSLHNEGEDFVRWPVDGKSPGDPKHDYNLFWPPRQVVEFMKILRPMMDRAGLKDIGIAPGETTNWWRFLTWGYAPAIWADDAAVQAMGLITSHGFTGGRDQWYGTHESRGIDLIRQKRPGMHAWTTSMTWGKMEAAFVDDIRGQIYTAKTNGVIPWAAVQTDKWVGGDPNPGAAYRVVTDCACARPLPGYYYYKQVSRAGQAGMDVAAVQGAPGLGLIAFAGGGAEHPDTFVIINTGTEPRAARVAVRGTTAGAFGAFRTTPDERYMDAGEFRTVEGKIDYTAPANSVTTFYARR